MTGSETGTLGSDQMLQGFLPREASMVQASIPEMGADLISSCSEILLMCYRKWQDSISNGQQQLEDTVPVEVRAGAGASFGTRVIPTCTQGVNILCMTLPGRG